MASKKIEDNIANITHKNIPDFNINESF